MKKNPRSPRAAADALASAADALADALVFEVARANPARSSGYDAPRTFSDFKSAEL
jgi:hypothetical protein